MSERRSILLVSPSLSTTGNYSTLDRIAAHLSTHYSVKLVSADDACHFLAENQSVDLIIAIHAYKSSCILSGIKPDVKRVLVFGGTDLTTYSQDKEAHGVMTSMVSRANACVAFSQWMQREAVKHWPRQSEKMTVIAQSVSTTPDNTFDFRRYLQEEHRLDSKYIVLLVAGIRLAKDPMFVLEEFTRSTDLQGTSLVVMGPMLDEQYSKKFLDYLKNLHTDTVIYIGALHCPQAHAAIQQSDCLVNTSISEGMSSAIIEAFSLETPVIARNNAGNSSVIDSGANGLLFDTPEDFISQLRQLQTNSELKGRIIRNAKASITERFSPEVERESYLKLTSEVLNESY